MFVLFYLDFFVVTCMLYLVLIGSIRLSGYVTFFKRILYLVVYESRHNVLKRKTPKLMLFAVLLRLEVCG